MCYRPFRRLWWDETVPTVVTRAEPHNQVNTELFTLLHHILPPVWLNLCLSQYLHISLQAVLHPEQDRVLTIRENARLQGFPDYYRLSGPVKERLYLSSVLF